MRALLISLVLIGIPLLTACAGSDDESATATQSPGQPSPASTVEPTPTSLSDVTPTEEAATIDDYSLVATWGGPAVPQFPYDVTLLDDGRIAVADLGLAEIQVFNADGALAASWRAPAPRDGNSERTFPPSRIVFANDSLYVGSAIRSHLTRYDLEGNVLAEHDFTQPDIRTNDLTAGPDGRIYLVAGDRQQRTPQDVPYGVLIFDADLNLLESWAPPERIVPLALDFDANGVAHVLIYDDTDTDAEANQVQPAQIVQIDPASYSPDTWQSPFAAPVAGQFDGLLLTADGRYILVEEASQNTHDSGVTTIHIVDPDGSDTIQWTLPEQGAIGLAFSPGLTLTGSDTFFITDPLNSRVIEVDLDGEILQTIKDDRPSRFAQPSGLAVGPDGTVFVADSVLSEVQQFSPDGERLGSLRFSRILIDPIFVEPLELAVDESGTIYLAGWPGPPAEALRSISPEGVERFIEVDELTDLDSDPPFIFTPTSIALGPDDLIYISMEMDPRIRAYNSDGETLLEWPAEPDRENHIIGVASGPAGVFATTAITIDEQRVWALMRVDESEEIIAVFQPGQFAEELVEGAISVLPHDFAVGADGAFYLLDSQDEEVVKLSPGGEEIGRLDLSDGVEHSFRAIAVDDKGRIYLADTSQRTILVYASTE